MQQKSNFSYRSCLRLTLQIYLLTALRGPDPQVGNSFLRLSIVNERKNDLIPGCLNGLSQSPVLVFAGFLYSFGSGVNVLLAFVFSKHTAI